MTVGDSTSDRDRGSDRGPSPQRDRRPVEEIPTDRLPPGFAETVENPPESPATPRPAATVVLMRDAADGIEVLLLRRVRTAGFVPGAWVFPGGRVDGDDAAPPLLERLEGISAGEVARRLELPPDAEPPAAAYLVAALREAFEETGILVGRDADGHPAPSAEANPDVRTLRDDLLADEDIFPAVLDAMGCRLDGGAVAYIAHWVTPVAEPRRYDTRFFAAAVSREQDERLHPAEMSASLWISPEDALERNDRGELPMVFPTIRTIEELVGFGSAVEVLDHWADRPVPRILPRLVRTPTGVGIEVPDPGSTRVSGSSSSSVPVTPPREAS